MNYRFSNLLGAPYRGGTLLIHDNILITPVGNKVSQIDLVNSTSNTLPFENLKQVRTLCVSPDGSLLLSVDVDGKSLIINRKRRALLHHFSFKDTVTAAKFSPDGKFVAVAVGRLVQVWRSPGWQKTPSPMELYRTYGQCHDTVLGLDWSPDSQFIAAASADLVTRVFSLDPIENYQPPTLAGHKDAVVGVFFTAKATHDAAKLAGKEVPHLYTVSRDGALMSWGFHKWPAGVDVNAVSRRKGSTAPKKRKLDSSGTVADGGGAAAIIADDAEEDASPEDAGPAFAGGEWRLLEKHYFMHNRTRLTAVDFHAPTGILVVGFSSGIFELHQMPEFDLIHALSISREAVTSLSFNHTGAWIAVGCSKLGQLLVWEWRSETYVIKQQGHYFDVTTASFSPDGALIATGADDCKVKVFQLQSGFCFVTFSEHTAPVTGVVFVPSGHALVSCSLDGTVRAYDLVRYRNFRTMTSPDPMQFSCVAIDPSGEIVVAGTVDTFQMCVWSLKTGRLLDMLAAHEGPVSGLAFCNTQPLLASCSWDKTVRTWDVFQGKGGVDVLSHNNDVLALAWRPDGRQLASATLDGQIFLWDPLDAVLQGTIEGRRDIAGGRLSSDRRSASNAASGACFDSLTYSADGTFLIAGGNSKYVCLYDIVERVMLRRFQITNNRSLDGVLDVLNSRNMTDAGPVDLIDAGSDDELDPLLPSAGRASEHDVPGAVKKKPIARSRAVCLSPSGNCWAAATTEGLLIYSLDDTLMFDPTELTEDLTPVACHKALEAKSFVRALLIALRLGDPLLLRHVVLSTPKQQVETVAAMVPAIMVPQMISALAGYMQDSPHVEFLLSWVWALCVRNGDMLQNTASGSVLAPAVRSLQKVLTRLHTDLSAACETNLYMLDYLISAPPAATANIEELGQDESM